MTRWRQHLASLDEHQRGDWEERAAIRTYDGGMRVHDAEFAAYRDWCKSNKLEPQIQDELFEKGAA